MYFFQNEDNFLLFIFPNYNLNSQQVLILVNVFSLVFKRNVPWHWDSILMSLFIASRCWDMIWNALIYFVSSDKRGWTVLISILKCSFKITLCQYALSCIWEPLLRKYFKMWGFKTISMTLLFKIIYARKWNGINNQNENRR